MAYIASIGLFLVVSIEDISRVIEALNKNNVPAPKYVWFYNAPHPIPFDNKWLLWLYMAESSANGRVILI